MIVTAGGGPNHQSIGFRYWNETGGFVQYEGIGSYGYTLKRCWYDKANEQQEVLRDAFSDFSAVRSPDSLVAIDWLLIHRITVLIQAAFAFIGTEITAIASAETANVGNHDT